MKWSVWTSYVCAYWNYYSYQEKGAKANNQNLTNLPNAPFPPPPPFFQLGDNIIIGCLPLTFHQVQCSRRTRMSREQIKEILPVLASRRPALPYPLARI